MPKKKQVFEPENLESIRSAISGLIVEPPETIEPVVYSGYTFGVSDTRLLDLLCT